MKKFRKISITGAFLFQGKDLADQLQKLDKTFVPLKECVHKYKEIEANEYLNNIFEQKHICAGGAEGMYISHRYFC